MQVDTYNAICNSWITPRGRAVVFAFSAITVLTASVSFNYFYQARQLNALCQEVRESGMPLERANECCCKGAIKATSIATQLLWATGVECVVTVSSYLYYRYKTHQENTVIRV